jgi:hypothetical protein
MAGAAAGSVGSRAALTRRPWLCRGGRGPRGLALCSCGGFTQFILLALAATFHATVWIAVGQFSCLPAMAGVRLAKLLSRAPSS